MNRNPDALPYLTMGRFLRRRFGRRVYKIGLDAGFSCPHRGSDRRRGGCSFCAPEGSRSPLSGSSDQVSSQINTNAAYWRDRYPDCGLLLYFQAYTSTYGPAEGLRRIYDAALAAAGESICGLVIGTRPDCLPDPVVRLLQTYRNTQREVWVELGLQSAHEASLRLLNRGHGIEAYRDAAARLAHAGIPVVPHLIFGIPGEGEHERHATLQWVLEHTPSLLGVKIHNLVLLPGTQLYRDYLAGGIPAWNMEDHLPAVVDFLCHLPPQLPVIRLTADIPAKTPMGTIPNRLWPTTVFTGRLQQVMRERGLVQGCKIHNSGKSTYQKPQ